MFVNGIGGLRGITPEQRNAWYSELLQLQAALPGYRQARTACQQNAESGYCGEWNLYNDRVVQTEARIAQLQQLLLQPVDYPAPAPAPSAAAPSPAPVPGGQAPKGPAPAPTPTVTPGPITPGASSSSGSWIETEVATGGGGGSMLLDDGSSASAASGSSSSSGKGLLLAVLGVAALVFGGG